MPDQLGNIHKYSFLGTWPGFLARQASSQVRELYLNSAILDFAVAMVMFFEPIYLYQQGVTLPGIMLFYLGVYFLYFFLLPLGAKFARQKGFEHSIFLSSPFLILYYLCLLLVAKSMFFLFPAALFFALQKIFYWPGFHADFAHYGKDSEQGSELGTLNVIISTVFILGPLVGGLLMYYFGFAVLFIVVAFLIILSNFPLLLTPERFEPHNFSYGKAFKRLFKPYNKRSFLAYLGFGEELIAMTLWPIFIFIVLGNTVSAGGLVAVSTLITSVVVLFVGKLADKRPKEPILRYTTIIYVLSWFLRILTRAPLGVFLSDTVGRIGKTALSVPLTARMYQRARQWGVVKQVTFFEMSLSIGKMMAIGLVMLILVFVPEDAAWPIIFLLAGFFSLLYTLA
ncbi:MAG: hypothetical protein A2445_01130 [Candidatus Jacksonbacteria bacterium RIFOXYC2_FULL_44_29]|nr:MAG: hypothetical protein A2240_00540 [Candidatus Jacksonbacteria bacterium RIFOXYA2_FULL_43_12]OGY77170.1 MAG: hypothetical protein A2295_04840 [Candidatus Jacksonbacteria bacterium RIFOXYB2_FULL_44_15]OGY78101.1 MAG: hypothetical protein A2550_03510 [Candidatus Jacksonbacteria bacterium RIFOXYD2_FULL_43_21]OGY79860.1 MAG: hypothetical protein A2445_01130 [Candidatus Jacksonbacteria bacterium RIFOXYC2_FULL_44_29]